METTGVRHGMVIMHSDVMDYVFHSGDALCHKLCAEVSAFLCLELTKYCPR